MNAQQVTKICNGIVDPISKFVENLSKLIENLASKDDINILIESLEKRHENELKERDLKISELENQITKIADSNRSINEEYIYRIEKLEENIKSHQENIQTLGHSTWVNSPIIPVIDLRNVENPNVGNENTSDAGSSDVKEELDLVVCGDSIVKYIQPDMIHPGKNNKLIC